MTEDRAHTCPICKLNEDRFVIREHDFGRDVAMITCPRCKKFSIVRTAEITADSKDLRPKLSGWIRNLNEQGAEVPEINSNTLKTLPATLPDYSAREKQIILLQNIERKTEYPGKPVQIVPNYDIPLAWASAKEEFLYYISSLIERGFIRRTDEVNEVLDDLTFFVAITADGWDYLEKQERHIEERTQAFVAMSFSPDLKPIWEGPIKNAIEKAGYKAHRVDAEPHSDLIDLRIISGIKDSRFLVADFTEQKYGVYFEAGYAQGMGLTIIRCVREDDFKNLHFDTNHYNYIVWKTPKDLEEQLYDFICAIIGKGKGT